GKPLLDEDGREIDPENPAAPLDRLQRGYTPILRWTLRHSWVTLGLAVLVLVGTIAAAPLMKTNFLGDSGQNTFTMTQDIGPAPSLEAESAAAEPVEEALLGIEGIETVQVSIGSSGNALRDAFTGGGSGITYSITTEEGVDQVALRQEVQDTVEAIPDVGEITVAGGNGGFGSTDIEVDVTAPDASTLQEATDAVVASLSDLDDVSQVTNNLSASLPFISVRVDSDKAASLGLSEVAVGAIVSSTMQPQNIGSVEVDDTSLTVYLAANDPPTTIDELRNLQVFTAQGPVPLSDVAVVEEAQGPTSITTEGGTRTATVTVTPATDNLSQATASVTEAIDAADLPSAARASLGGVATDQADAFSQLGLALLAAILIVYVVMVATFKSLRQPLLLLISVPFAATGAILLQIVTGIPLGVASLIGVLMLIGIVVTNAIVLVDLVNQYREKGLSAHDATIAGGTRRLRPILMTALATILALTPMGLGITGTGGFISQPLAIVVIGGLISSTVLTLLVLPTLYNLVEGAKERRQAKRAARSGQTDAEGALALAGVAGAAGGAGAGGAEDVPLTRRELREREALRTGQIPIQAPAEPDEVSDAATGAPETGDVPTSADSDAAEEAVDGAEPASGDADRSTTDVGEDDVDTVAPDAGEPEAVEPEASEPEAADAESGEHETDDNVAADGHTAEPEAAADGDDAASADAEPASPESADSSEQTDLAAENTDDDENGRQPE
ncbi:efflux RND transporter permease subunit, partial [Microbacterium sp. UBA837]